MEKNKASMTAKITAFGRAYHSLKDDNPKIFDDSLAYKMMTDEEYKAISSHMARAINFFNPQLAKKYSSDEALKWVIQTQIAPTPLARSRFAEDMLLDALKLGVTQYVILGAGFDTFAFRKTKLLEKLRVFEVDHSSTQKLKLERLKQLGWDIINNHKFVSTDFTKDNLTVRLLDNGFDKTKLTFFSLLGVSYYLTEDEINKILNCIASISPKGSMVVFDYPDSGIFNKDNPVKRVKDMVALASGAGEPMKSCFEYDELKELLAKANFSIYEHINSSQIENKYFSNRIDFYHAFENINYAVAMLNS
ncbi:class I SAM-dependent methyltransferase [Clostridiaceae bacterium M8S5]|nr:class I SAM-dependent methyltransferase [Clostridiaceae bacterium M8S5]